MLFVFGSKVRPLPTVKPVTPKMESTGVDRTAVRETSAVVPAVMKITLLAEGVAELPVPEADALATALPVEERLAGLPEETLPMEPAEVDPPKGSELLLLTELPEALVGALAVEADMLAEAKPEAGLAIDAELPVEAALSEKGTEVEDPRAPAVELKAFVDDDGAVITRVMVVV